MEIETEEVTDQKLTQVKSELTSQSLSATQSARERIAEHKAWRELIYILADEFNKEFINIPTIEEAEELLEEELRRKEDTDGLDTITEPKKKFIENKYDVDETNPFEAIIDLDRPEAEPRVNDDAELTIGNDVTGESKCTGDKKDFLKYFRSRAEQMGEIFEGYRGLTRQKLSSLSNLHSGDDVTVGGLVSNIRTSQNGDPMFTIEDESTERKAVWMDGDEFKETKERLLHDEYVLVRGQYEHDDEKGGIIFADDVIFPNVSPNNSRTTLEDSGKDYGKVAIISDIHFASDEFSVHRWNAFVDWVRQNPEIKYILVCGDMVEGINVYPEQDEELYITDVDEQYRLCAEAFKELPDDTEIVCITGNHDDVRLEEPQPAVRERHREHFGDNVQFTGNPSYVNIDDVRFLMYHGVSLHSMAEELSESVLEQPSTCMTPLLEKRHLAPVYDEDPRQAPEHYDYHVIGDVPDVFVTGHVHMLGVDEYNDVLNVNPSCWQEQTAFQKSKNIQPDVGYCGIYDLETGEMDLMHFVDEEYE